MNIELFALNVFECIILLFHHLIFWAREVQIMHSFMLFSQKKTTYKMLIADVNPEQTFIPSIDENLCNWKDCLSVVFPSQVTSVTTRFSRPTPETYCFLFAPTNYMSPMARKRHIPPPLDLDVKRKKVEYKYTTIPGEECKVLALRPSPLSLVSRCKTS